VNMKKFSQSMVTRMIRMYITNSFLWVLAAIGQL